MRSTSNLTALFNKALPIALGPPGQPGDPDGILYVANRVGNIYRSLMQWKLDFLRLSSADELLQLRSLFASLCDNNITEIEEFVIYVSSALADALNKPPGGPPQVLNLTLKLTVPDQTPLTQELARVTNLIATGDLKWH
jgi:hypothetical protein